LLVGNQLVLCNLLLLLQVLLAGSNSTNTNADNACDVNAIAGPDNLFYTNHNLLVAEDTSKHQNNFLWAYNLQTGVRALLFLLLLFASGTAMLSACQFEEIDDSSSRAMPCTLHRCSSCQSRQASM
jgi:hypothetical protein